MSKGVAGRVLVIDDNPGIHEDFAKILLREEPAPLNHHPDDAHHRANGRTVSLAP